MKLKTKKSLSKRLKKTRKGVVSINSCRRHNNLKKTSKFIRGTRKSKVLHKSDGKRLKHFIKQM